MIGAANALKRAINGALGLTGLRLVKNDRRPEDAALRQILTHLAVSVVFDVGAHSGQYASRLRSLGYRERIISFEPQSAPFLALSKAAKADASWEVFRLALADREGEQDLNISLNSWSSSFLPVTTHIVAVEPGLAQVTCERVPLKSLNQIYERFVRPSDKVFLKIDAQGYEPNILAGGRELMLRCTAIQLEMALLPSYEGQTLFHEMLNFMREQGFALVFLEPVFSDPATGYLVEADGIFVRFDVSAALFAGCRAS
jgi:FkbM family methyltransferase